MSPSELQEIRDHIREVERRINARLDELDARISAIFPKPQLIVVEEGHAPATDPRVEPEYDEPTIRRQRHSSYPTLATQALIVQLLVRVRDDVSNVLEKFTADPDKEG